MAVVSLDLSDSLFVLDPDTQSPSILRIRDLLETLPLLDALQVSGILFVSANPTQLLYRPRLLVTLSITNRDWGQSDWGAEEWGDAKLTKRYSSEDIEA